MDTGNLAYLTAVQGSDDTVDLCDFIYSGPFSNATDFEKCLKSLLQGKGFKFGCRLKKTKELPEAKNMRDWLLKPNMMIHLEVDRSQVRSLKAVLYQLFNKQDCVRPRGYNFRVLPDKSQLRTGTKGDADRVRMLRKHQANTMSLVVFKTEDLRDLDVPYEWQGNRYTLREVLLGLTFPLFKTGRSAKKLFFTVDYASSGADKARGTIYITAYRDRKDLAEKIVDILPAYLSQIYGRFLTEKWCHPLAREIIDEITFITDSEGNETGEWTTKEDEQVQNILDEYMGCKLDFENLELLEFDAHERVHKEAEDASVQSFRTALGARGNLNDDQEDSGVPGASQATTANLQGAVSGAVPV
jgi:hypothetical protein